MPFPPISRLRAFTEAWASRLGLGDASDGGWEISVLWATKTHESSGLIDADCAGSCSWMVEHKQAFIYVSRRMNADWPEIQETLLHELLHIRLEGHLDRAKRYDAHYEHAINYLSKMLLTIAAEEAA